MRTVIHNAGAGSAVRFSIGGNYFHLLETVAAVDIRFYRGGGIFAEAVSMEGGFYSQPEKGFEEVEIVSASAQAIKFAIADGTGGYNRTTGSVSVSNLETRQGVFTQAVKTVTNASAQLLAANSARRSLLVQNNHATGNVFITINGSAATTANGIKIAPGGLILLDAYSPSGAINAIGDIASNAAIVAVEA